MNDGAAVPTFEVTSTQRPRAVRWHRLLIATLATVAVAPAGADEARTPVLDFSGDARLLITGDDQDSEEGSVRVRAGAVWTAKPGLAVVMRAATSASTSGNEWGVGTYPDAQTSSGLAPGNVTLDLAHLQLEAESGLKLRIGRFQESLALPAVPDKSLDRKDSDGTGISYSDGLSAEYPVGRGWQLLGIAQYQPDGGATNRPREPLSFDESRNPASGYFALRRSDDTGPWALTSLSYSVFPDSLVEGGSARTYTGLVGNVMRRVPVDGVGQLLIGGSAGYAPEIPDSVPPSRESRWGWQATANLVDFGPREQGFGVVYLRAGAGWLLSPDLANARWLAEARYRFAPVRGLTCELRLRYRGDTVNATPGESRGTDRDWYLRLTWHR